METNAKDEIQCHLERWIVNNIWKTP